LVRFTLLYKRGENTQRFIEALQRIGIKRKPAPFEQARRVMKEAGGKKLVLRVAKELREQGDLSAIVVEEKGGKDCSTNKLALRFGLQESTKSASTKWESKEVSVVVKNGDIIIDASFLPDDSPLPLNQILDAGAMALRVGSKQYFPPRNIKNMSLEEQFRLAMEIAIPIPDFRYGEGEQSLKQKTVKSKLSKTIF